MKKKMFEPFGSCLLNFKANPAQFRWKWTGLAVLFGRQLRMAPIFFHAFSKFFFFNYSVKNPRTKNAPIFLTHIISGIGVVIWILG